ncbi:protein-L-isoaspartate(D-aspartate) O-methyltransferase, partial [Ralstonia pseudosolanacearum]|uniref:protein-L-isoaspartate(D-aspartate) O-methyltransferase n=2 Tax=Ralstonia pseudosolanacearum TaxID=1310165 RepID=UPI003CF4776D
CGHDAAAALRVLASLENEARLDTAAFGTPDAPARSSVSSATFHDAISEQEAPNEPDGPPPQSPSARSSASSEAFFDAMSVLEEPDEPEDAGAAWRTAQLLSRYHAGFEALCDLMRLPQTPAHRHAAHAFLQAADALQRGAASPRALLQHCPPGSGAPDDSLAIKTLHAAAAQLRGEALSPEQTGALFAWRQGFRAEGPGSDLAKVKARTAKFVNRTIRRVENHGWRSTLWQVVGKKKSPLSAARLGMQAAHRVSLDKEYTAYAASLRTALGMLGARYREALALSPAHADLPWKQAEQMWQGAILQHWASLPADAPLSAYVLTHDTLRMLGEQLRHTVLRVREELTISLAHSAEAGDTPDPGMLDKLKTLVELSRQANLNLGASNLPVAPPPQFIDAYPSGAVLRKWSEQVDAGAASGPLRKALDTAERIEQQDDLKLQEAAIDAARGVIESLITTIEGGGKLRLASGTSLGVNTGTISTGLQNARQALAVPVAIQADFHASHKRQAVVEIARGSHGRDLFVGTDKTVLAAAGFGASVGYDFKVLQNRIRAMVGASVVPIDVEKGERVGVMYRAVRQALVARVQAAGVTDARVLAAIGRVPRHLFVDAGLASQAYEDAALPIGHQQTISKPSVVGRMIELLLRERPEPSAQASQAPAQPLSRVLEIGTGCGYQAAVLSQVAGEVYSIERIRPLHEKAKANLRPLRVPNIRLHYGDGMLGLPKAAPFDAIIVAAAGLEVPQALLDQLAIGGRLIAPVATDRAGGPSQQLVLIERRGRFQFHSTALEGVFFVPLKSGTV